jgi:hypothetical protein
VGGTEEGKGHLISRTTKLAGFSARIDIICISKEYETGEFPITLQKSRRIRNTIYIYIYIYIQKGEMQV